MKKLILVIAATVISAGTFAQIDSIYRKTTPQNIHQNQRMQINPADKSVPDGVMMQYGKIMKVQNGTMTTLDHEMIMSNGTKIRTDGNYTNNDGLTMMLTEGQHIDMEGNLTIIRSDKDKIMYLVPDSTRKYNY